MSPLAFILLLGLTTPQSQLAAVHQVSADKPGQGTFAGPHTLAQQAFRNGTCYAIRSYLFHREDGDAPVLVGTITCTPAETVRSERVARPAKIVTMDLK